MPEQFVERDLTQLAPGASGDCFAMVVVAKKRASGVLMGDVAEMRAGQSILCPVHLMSMRRRGDERASLRPANSAGPLPFTPSPGTVWPPRSAWLPACPTRISSCRRSSRTRCLSRFLRPRVAFPCPWGRC